MKTLDVSENMDLNIPHIDRVMHAGKIYLIETESDRDKLPVELLAGTKLAAVGEVKAKAGEIILGKYPQHVQANMTARAVELMALGTTQGPEWDAIQAAWGWVKSIRSASNILETEVNLCVSKSAIEKVIADFVWPE